MLTETGHSNYGNVAAGRRAPAVDAGVFAQIRGFRPAAKQRILGLYLRDAPRTVAELRDSVENNDPRSVMESAHRLKSSSATLGAKPLASLCHDLEKAGKSGNLAAAQPLLSDLARELEAVVAELSCMVEERSEAG